MKLYTVMLNTNAYYFNMTEQFINDNRSIIKKVYLQKDNGQLEEVHNY